MKRKTNRRKKIQRNYDLVQVTLHNDKKCPECKQVKKTIHFVHKNTFKDKRLIELLLCEDCTRKYQESIIASKDKKFFYLLPMLNSMLQKVGKFEEKTIEQLNQELEVFAQEVENEKT